MTRDFLRTVCRALIGVVLFAQLAVSAHACPGLPSAATPTAVAATDHKLVNCEDMAGPMDPEFANLCAEHCHQGQQSDQAATLTVPAALLTALYITPLAPEPAVAPRPVAAATSALAAAAPPLAILHCCFRL
jgi:hypothetical protein